MSRPIKIDLADGPCPHCAEASALAAKRCCADCKQPIPVYPGMGGAGYESATVHFHLGDILGRQTWLGVNRELCRPCYLIDYAKQFPGAALPDLK